MNGLPLRIGERKALFFLSFLSFLLSFSLSPVSLSRNGSFIGKSNFLHRHTDLLPENETQAGSPLQRHLQAPPASSSSGDVSEEGRAQASPGDGRRRGRSWLLPPASRLVSTPLSVNPVSPPQTAPPARQPVHLPPCS